MKLEAQMWGKLINPCNIHAISAYESSKLANQCWKWNPVKNNHNNFNDIEKEWSDSFFSLTKLLASPYSLSIHSNVAKMFWKILVGIYVKSVTPITRFSIVYLKILSLSG